MYIEIEIIQTKYTIILLMNSFLNLNTYREVTVKLVVAGDFNIDLLKINVNAVIGDYFNSLVAQSFFPQITLPTRFSDKTAL